MKIRILLGALFAAGMLLTATARADHYDRDDRGREYGRHESRDYGRDHGRDWNRGFHRGWSNHWPREYRHYHAEPRYYPYYRPYYRPYYYPPRSYYDYGYPSGLSGSLILTVPF